MAKDVEKKITKKTQVRMERERIQKRYLITGTIILGLIIVGVITYGLLDQFVLKQYKSVAKVDNTSITVQEFQNQVGYQRWQLIQQYLSTYQTSQLFASDASFSEYFKSMLDQITSQLDDPKVLGESVLDSLIDGIIIEQEAKSMGITVSDTEVEQEIQGAFGYYANGTPTSMPTSAIIATSTLSPTQLALVTATPTEAIPTVAPPTATSTAEVEIVSPTPTTTNLLPTATATPYTLEGYEEQVKNYFSQLGDVKFSEVDLKKLFRLQLLSAKITERLTTDLSNTEERVWARHILVSTEEEGKAVITRLNDGEDFSSLAAELSQDSSNKDKGGDLGWFARGKMVAEFEDVAFSLQIGETSQPIKTQFGYHIIQILGHDFVSLTTDELEQKRQAKFSEWLATAKEAKKIEKFDIWEDVVPTEPALSDVLQ